MRTIGLALCLAVPLWLVAFLPVAAQDDSDFSAADAEARQVFELGVRAFDEGRNEDALEHFERSYELSERPQLLYNIGTVNDRMRRDRQALEAFERFLDEVPDTPLRGQVEARIRVLRDAVDRDQPAPTPEETAEAAQEPQPQPFAPAPADDGSASIFGQWWFWTVVGVVVASTVATVLLLTLDGGTQGPLPGDDGRWVEALRWKP